MIRNSFNKVVEFQKANADLAGVLGKTRKEIKTHAELQFLQEMREACTPQENLLLSTTVRILANHRKRPGGGASRAIGDP